MREREVYMLYEMNKESHIVIETSVGMTDSITVHEIVKQGTIFGPKLCSVATEQINGIGEEISTHITPEHQYMKRRIRNFGLVEKTLNIWL